MEATILFHLKCPTCGHNDDLIVIAICEGGILACECGFCEHTCAFTLTEVLQECFEEVDDEAESSNGTMP